MLKDRLNQSIETQRVWTLKAKAEREVKEWEQGWEKTKESVVLINNGVQLKETVFRSGLTTSPQWLPWERHWQQEEQAWKSWVRAENLSLLKELHKRDQELRFSTADEIHAENQWRQTKREELNQRLAQIRTQKTQSLQEGLNQLVAAEQVRIQKIQAQADAQIVQFFVEAATDVVTDYLETEAVQIQKAIERGRAEQEAQDNAKITEFITDTATSAVTEYLEATRIAEQARDDAKIVEFIADTATSAITEYLETEAAQIQKQTAQKIRIQAIQGPAEEVEDTEPVQYITETGTTTSAVTEYLETLAREEAEKIARIQQARVGQVTRTTITSPDTIGNLNPVNRVEEPEKGLGTRIWNATVGDTRLQGGFKMLGGVGEMVFGGLLLVIPEPTMLSKVGAVALLGHGADVLAAGLRQIWSGESTSSFTAQAVSGGLNAAGVNPVHANLAGELTEIGVAGIPIGIVGKAAATARITSDAARRQAMRMAGMPTSQQPVSQLRTDAGMQYIYEMHGKRLAVDMVPKGWTREIS